MMKISIALCTYNGERYLQQQLDSILEQTLAPSELVICDDRSSDATEAIVAGFARRVPYPVRWHRNEANLGSTRNFERAIGLCTGEAIALCDQDDLWHPEKLQRVGEVLTRNPDVSAVFSNASLIDEHSKPLTGDLWSRNRFGLAQQRSFDRRRAPYRLMANDTVTGATFVFRSSFVQRILPISTAWVHDGWIAILLSAIGELRALPACLIQYRLHAAQQIGAKQVAWHDHLSTEKTPALLAHQKNQQRFSDLAERLTLLQADAGLIAEVKRKADYFRQRASLLEEPRRKRIALGAGLLGGYSRYDKGVMSYLRDLAH